VTFFLADLARQITVPMAIDYLGVGRYSRDATNTTQQSFGFAGTGRQSRRIGIERDLDNPIAGRHVILVEDVVNTGLTLAFLLGALNAREPASVSVVTLLGRPARRLVNVPLKYVGFQIPNDFVVGYGL